MNLKLRLLVLAADLVCIIVGCAAALGSEGPSRPARGFLWMNIVLPLCLWSVLCLSKKLEGFQGGWSFPRLFAQVTVGVLYLTISSWALMFFFHAPYPLRALGIQTLMLWCGFIGTRCLARWMLSALPYARSKRRVIILGAGRTVRELAIRISRHPEANMEVAGVLSPCPGDSVRNAKPAGTICLRTMNVLGLLKKERVRELIAVEPLPSGMEMEKLMASCRKSGIHVHLVPQRYELYLSKAKLVEIDGIPLLSLDRPNVPVLGLRLKRGIDLFGSGWLLVLGAPLLALLTFALRAAKGTGMNAERRIGKDGLPFRLYRLNVDREALDLAWWERLLVRLSLTELPQLWNVLRGEMSLVGPRPEPESRVRHYSVWQRQRLNVTPGLTGLAQVHGLREQHSSEEKAKFDLEYIFQWSLFLDFSLLLQTIWILFVRCVKPNTFRSVMADAREGRGKAEPQTHLDSDFLIPQVMHADRAQSGTD